jgi:hypothetical protein
MEEIQSNEQTPSAPEPAGGSDATPDQANSSDSQEFSESAVVEAIEDLANSAMNLVTDVIVSVTDALGLIPDIETGNIPRGIQDGKKVIQDIEEDAKDLQELINKFNKIKTATEKEMQTPGFKNLVNGVEEFFIDVGNFVVAVKDEIKNRDFQDIPKTFADEVKKAGTELQNSFNSIQEVEKDFGEKLQKEENKLPDTPPAPVAERISSATPQIPESIKDAAKGLLNNATHATTEAAQGASEAIGESMSKIGSALGK